MKMIICEKCGSISYYDHYFQKYICSGCRHSQTVPEKRKLAKGNIKDLKLARA